MEKGYKKKSYKKKTYKKKSQKASKKLSKWRPQPSWLRTVSGFPQRLNFMLKYAFYKTLNPSTTGVSYNSFKLNSVYDPDQTGIGNQPRFYDQIFSATLYRKYIVTGCAYEVEFVNQASTNALIGVIVGDTGLTVPSTDSDLWYSKELPRHKIMMLPPAGQSNYKKTIKGYTSISSILANKKSSYMEDDTYQGSYNSDPNTVAYLRALTSAAPLDGTGANVDIYVTLRFTVTAFNLAGDVAQS
jgi:hypothetical protein